MLNQKSFYKQVQITYPKADLGKALLQYDKVITKILEAQYNDIDTDSINKFIVSCVYIDNYYFNNLNIDSKDTSFKFSLSIDGRDEKILTIKETLSYAYLGLKLYVDKESNDIKRYLFLSKELCSKWRPYLWEKVESLLD